MDKRNGRALNIDQLLKFGIVQSGGILAGAFGPVEGLVRVKTIEALVKRLPHLDNEELIEILAQLTNGNLRNNSQEGNQISYEDYEDKQRTLRHIIVAARATSIELEKQHCKMKEENS